MSTEQQNNRKLKTACLGLGRGMGQLLALAQDTGLYEIISVSDGDLSAAEKVARQFNCTAFDDYRQFTLQNNIEILIVAEPLYKCAEHIRAAINKKCHILKLAPTASNFEQATEMINLAQKNNVKYITASPSKFAPGFERLADFLKTVDIKQYYFVNICAAFGDDFFQPIISDSLADPKLSGGGALINDCFELLGLVASNFFLPQQIYALLTNRGSNKKARQFFGEDTVTASLIFKEGLIGTFLASRQAGTGAVAPIRIYGAENNIVVTPNRLAIYDNSGLLIDEHKYPLKPEKCITEMFIDTGRAILEPKQYKLRTSSRLDLGTMALIEAAYLSAKTGMPEALRKIFEMSEKEKFSLI
jgi:predicted dehydrogenase